MLLECILPVVGAIVGCLSKSLLASFDVAEPFTLTAAISSVLEVSDCLFSIIRDLTGLCCTDE